MKKLLVIILVAGLFTDCKNSDNPFAKKGDKDKTEKEETDEPGQKKKKNNSGEEDVSNNNTSSNWSKSQRNAWMNKCLDEYKDDPNADQICSCVLGKMEQKYPDEKDAREVSERESDRIIADCEAGVKADDYNTGTEIKRIDRNTDDLNDGNTIKSWTTLQRQQYIQGCETTARQNNRQGYSDQQINSYCNCMTRKVEKKYSFQQAAKMTAADFQTQEWQNAAADCMPHY